MRHSRNRLILLLLAALLSCASGLQGSSVRPVHARHAIVASVHELASRAGVDIMQAGGNAVDAAVATGFALAVVHPEAGNLGGGGFMLIRMADGATHFIDYREKAPAAATANMYLDPQGKVIEDASVVGYKAIGVPGSVAGMVYAEKKYGKLTLKQVIAPAIKLAREGFALAWEDAHDLRAEESLATFPDSRRIFQRDGKYYEQEEIFRQPELARTLERIAADPDDFYHGAMARELATFIQNGGGLLTAEDLDKYEVKERESVRGRYRGYDIISAPPPSAGGTALIEILNILEGYDLAKLGNRSSQSIQLTVEAFRRAYFDKSEFMGDPDFSRIPVAQLIDKKYGAAWRESIDPAHATPSKDLKRPAIFSELEQYARQNLQPMAVREPDHTTHYSVVDSEGNAVSVTTTLNDSFGSRVTAGNLGFLLNDEMDDFAAKPGVPNLYGLVQGSANSIGPGKRPLSSMTPTIVLKDGKLFLVLGSPGGARIPTTIANILMAVVDYGMNIQEAVNTPRFHHQWLPDQVSVEQWFSPDAIKSLKQMGHKIEIGETIKGEWTPYWSDGECIAIDLSSGERLGASDGRHNGRPVGY
ncbi:MAG TPA: gamma-glutamyltransferase [Terriglobales bacterium]|jgi:gamma-glutamyltranspeptidase/glutathione hydrolase|nr:gamma-glutamyltransferase [Terriglobales bacterium]